MVHSFLCMVYGVRCMVYGVWCIMYYVWCIVYYVLCIMYYISYVVSTPLGTIGIMTSGSSGISFISGTSGIGKTSGKSETIYSYHLDLVIPTHHRLGGNRGDMHCL